MSSEWETVVGLEVHAHLKTRTKMFCRCELEYGAAENTRTCPVCLAHPGALPVANGKAIEHTIKLGLALDCEIADSAVFARKNYFYPDLPKGYQISQYEAPLCGPGRLVVPTADGDEVVRIVRAHLEEDAAKTVHAGGATGRSVGADYSLVDFNRGGTPLLEIVSEPDLRSSEAALRFLRLLRQTIVELGVSDAEMEKGTMRADVNVSVRKRGRGGIPAALGAEEHELVHVHRARHRGGGARADRRCTSAARRSSSRRTTTTPTPTGSRCTARRRRRTTTATSRSPTSCRSSRRRSWSSGCAQRCPSRRARASAGSSRRSGSTSRTRSSRRSATRCTTGWSREGVEPRARRELGDERLRGDGRRSGSGRRRRAWRPSSRHRASRATR